MTLNKYIVCATAGHIDHGKTSLIKAITSVDLDTNPEEKKRGITINNGYTYFDVDAQNKIGFVDVPGHQKFIKTMLVGASGVQFFMLVICAKEGIKPQTREHLQILKLLNVNEGLVVLTKTDLVDKQQIVERRDEIQSFLKGNNFSKLPIIESSIIEKSGIDSIKNMLGQFCMSFKEKSSKNNQARFYIDRKFIVDGSGIVVTGYLNGKSISKGDDLFLLGANQSIKVRRIENHGREMDKIVHGMRASLNISGIKHSQIFKNSILSNQRVRKSNRCDVFITSLNSSNFTLIKQIKVYIRNREVEGKVSFLSEQLSHVVLNRL